MDFVWETEKKKIWKIQLSTTSQTKRKLNENKTCFVYSFTNDSNFGIQKIVDISMIFSVTGFISEILNEIHWFLNVSKGLFIDQLATSTIEQNQYTINNTIKVYTLWQFLQWGFAETCFSQKTQNVTADFMVFKRYVYNPLIFMMQILFLAPGNDFNFRIEFANTM